MKYFFPKADKTFLQTNRSTVLGTLWSTMNADFQSSVGVIRIDPRLQVLTKTGDTNATTLGRAVGFTSFGGAYYTVAGSKVYVGGSVATAAFVEDTAVTTSTDYDSNYSDITTWNSRVWTTAPSKLRSFSGGTWTDRATFVSTTQPHMMSIFTKFPRLYVIHNATTVASIDTSDVYVSTGDYSLTVDSAYRLTCISYSDSFIWIGAVNNENPTGQGVVFQWDGISAQPTNIYYIVSRGCLAIIVKENIPFIMDARAELKKYSGTGFDEVARLPIPTKLFGSVNSTNDRWIHPNGLAITKNNTILAFVNNLVGDPAATIPENMPSGIWEWAEGYGFTHKKSLTYNRYNDPTTITDWGQNRVSLVGGMALAFDNSTAGIITPMIGATYYTDASTTTSAIFIENTTDTVQKKGYVVSTFFESNEVEDKWLRLYAIYRRFLDSGDSIVAKYRLYEENPVEATITWTSTTTFTTTTDISAYWTSGIGGEVEVTQGKGSGACAHITNIVNVAGTYTVTLDSVITGVSGTAKARFQSWIRLNALDESLVRTWQQMAINANGTKLEIKLCFTFTGQGEFYKSAIDTNSDIKISP